MKQTLLLALTALALVSCEKPLSDASSEKSVTFRISGISTDYITRAALSDESLTDLYVYEGTTLLTHQVGTDADFGSPSITLSYGSHNLTFVASKSTGQSWASGQWTCTKVGDTYGLTSSIQVSDSSSVTQSIELSRVNSIIRWTIEDAIPTNATTLRLTIDTYPYSLTAALNGTQAQAYTANADISSWQGATGKTAQVRLLPVTYQTETTVNATISFLDELGDVITTYTTPTPLLTNRITNIHGTFFNSSSAKPLTITTAWLTQKNIDLTGTDTDASL